LHVQDRDALRQRAQQRWEGRVQDACEVEYAFEDVKKREEATLEEFCEWYQKEALFVVHSFEFGDVLSEGDMGWVDVHYNATIRRFPDLPPRDAQHWEKWHRVEGGQWYPVPKEVQNNYPASPVVRDAAEEARLRSRFNAAWEARKASDWHRLYEMTDPRDHETVPESQFAEAEAYIEYRTCEVYWVEVIGDSGRVRAAFYHKLKDPSLTKLRPRIVLTNERWVKQNNDWYLDLKRSS
jgi:acyl transferase domain-containing protein